MNKLEFKDVFGNIIEIGDKAYLIGSKYLCEGQIKNIKPNSIYPIGISTEYTYSNKLGYTYPSRIILHKSIKDISNYRGY